MGSDSIPLWCAFILCVIGGAYFAAAESSFSAVNKIKIKAMADDGNKRAKGVMYIVNHWTVVCRNWDMVSNQLRILFEGRETV